MSIVHNEVCIDVLSRYFVDTAAAKGSLASVSSRSSGLSTGECSSPSVGGISENIELLLCW